MEKPKLTNKDFCEAAGLIGCKVSVIKSVASVESGGRGGFDEQGRVLLRFEGHKFRGFTGGRFDHSHPTVSYVYHGSHKRCGKLHGYSGFNQAFALDQLAAMKSCSLGMFQPMVFNYHEMGFGSVGEMFDFFKLGEREQLIAFVRLIKHWGLDDELRRANLQDLMVFAARYNGASYRDNNYHNKMHDGIIYFDRQNIDCKKILAELTPENVGEQIDSISHSTDDNKAGLANRIIPTKSTTESVADGDDTKAETATEPGNTVPPVLADSPPNSNEFSEGARPAEPEQPITVEQAEPSPTEPDLISKFKAWYLAIPAGITAYLSGVAAWAKDAPLNLVLILIGIAGMITVIYIIGNLLLKNRREHRDNDLKIQREKQAHELTVLQMQSAMRRDVNTVTVVPKPLENSDSQPAMFAGVGK